MAPSTTISRACADHIETELARLLDDLHEMREQASALSEITEADEVQAYYGQLAIYTAGVMAEAADSHGFELDDDAVDPEGSKWLYDLVATFSQSAQVDPWDTPSSSVVAWAKTICAKRPTPNPAVACVALLDALNLEVEDEDD